MLRNLALLGASLLLALALMEAVLRQLYPVPATWAEPQLRHVRSPLLGWVLPPSSQSFSIDAPVSVNALGLRDDEFPRRKPAGERRVLVLGDSFTFALGVRFEDLYVQRLEARLRQRLAAPVQVINAGVAGYNTRQELIYLLAEGLDLEPDLVVVGFYWNDLIGNEAALPDLDSPRYQPDAPELEEHRHELPGWLRNPLRKSLLLYTAVARAKGVWALIRPPEDLYHRAQAALLSGDAEALAPAWEATRERLLALVAAARERGIPAALLFFPMENQVRRDYPALDLAGRLRAISAEADIPFVDLEPAYRAALAEGRNPFLPYDAHPNAAGMEIAAEALDRLIAEQGWLGAAVSDVGAP